MVLELTTYFAKAPLLQNLLNGLSAYEFFHVMKYWVFGYLASGPHFRPPTPGPRPHKSFN